MKATDEVLAVNPTTGKTSRFTRKAFDGVYAEKGFTLVTRDNADEVVAAGRNRQTSERGGGSKNKAPDAEPAGAATKTDGPNAGAASIAANLNLEGETGKEKENEKRSNSQDTVSDERPSAGRTRDRGN